MLEYEVERMQAERRASAEHQRELEETIERMKGIREKEDHDGSCSSCPVSSTSTMSVLRERDSVYDYAKLLEHELNQVRT